MDKKPASGTYDYKVLIVTLGKYAKFFLDGRVIY
jgi:hypothetical protein